MVRYAWLPLVLVLGGLLSCVEYVQPVPGPVGTRIHIDMLLVDFGVLAAGQEATQELTITSNGDDNLHLDEITLTGPTSFSMEDSETNRLLAPGESTTIQVTYAAWSDGEELAELHVESNDPGNRDVAVALRARGIAPRIELDPETWDLGDEEVGCELEQEITIRNAGSTPLILSEVIFTPSSDEMQENHYFGGSYTLEPMAEETITIFYQPRDELADTGYLHVYSNDPATPDAQASQYGTAHLADQQVEVFTQNWPPMTDILWVYDNSPSMQPLAAELATSLTLFLDLLDVIDLDWHLALVSTSNAELHGAVPIMTPLTPDPQALLVDALGDAVLEGNGDSQLGFQRGFEALTPPLAAPGGVNDGFLRDQAGLRVIFISDEDDESPDTVMDHVSQFQSLKVNPDHVLLSAVTGQGSGCTAGDLEAAPAPRYEQAVLMTNGINESICNPSWVNTFSNLFWMWPNGGDTFELGEQPVESTIEVDINGAPLTVGWSYEPVYNAVVFAQDYIPNQGDEITIRYNELGTCS